MASIRFAPQIPAETTQQNHFLHPLMDIDTNTDAHVSMHSAHA